VTLLLTDEEVRRVASTRALVDAIRRGYEVEARGGVQIPERMNLQASPGFFRVMPAVVPGCDVMGFKVFNQVASGGVQYLIGLCDEKTGELLSLMDGAYLTAARTGAATGVAAAFLAPEDATDVGVIGSGLEAETNLAAVCAVLPVERVTVFSPNEGRRRAFADRVVADFGVEAVAVDEPEAAARCPVVVVATFTGYGTGRVALMGDWLDPGTCVLSIGSTMPSLREIDTRVVARAGLVVCDAPAQAGGESGDMIAAREEGLLDGKVVSLAELVAGTAVPARDGRQITLYKSVGTGLQDLMAAKAVYDEAVAAGVGTSTDLLMVKEPAGS
jgi:ornithine cyclodeaminase/alanine dehydrogenase-like protein (mu-crystallin family)